MQIFPTDLLSGESKTLANGETYTSPEIPYYAYEGDAKPSLLLEVSGTGSVDVSSITRHEVGGDFYGEHDAFPIIEKYKASYGAKVHRFSIPVCLAAKLTFVATGAVVISKASLTSYIGS